MDIVRAGIEALADGSVVLPTPSNVRQNLSDVKQNWSYRLLEERITEIVLCQTEQAKAELRAELLGEWVA
jgi:hypothetical protein